MVEPFDDKWLGDGDSMHVTTKDAEIATLRKQVEELTRERDKARKTRDWLERNSALKNPIEPSIYNRAETAEAANAELREYVEFVVDRIARASLESGDRYSISMREANKIIIDGRAILAGGAKKGLNNV